MKDYVDIISFKKIFNILNYIFFQLFSISFFLCISSCVDDSNLDMNYSNSILCMWNQHRQLISTIQNYQIQGSIIYSSIDFKKKTYFKFIWIKQNNNHYNIKLFNIFGCTIISISIKNGIIYVLPNITYQNNDLVNKIQKWFIQTDFFEKQLKYWIIGLPGDSTKYRLNCFGYLSDISYCLYNKNLSIFYCHYYNDNTPALPENLEVHYNTYFIKLHIDYWNL